MTDVLDFFCSAPELPEPTRTLADAIEEAERKAANGPWYPASGGTEKPFFTRSGRRLQYLYQPSTGRHAYYDCDSDLILTNEEAFNLLGV